MINIISINIVKGEYDSLLNVYGIMIKEKDEEYDSNIVFNFYV